MLFHIVICLLFLHYFLIFIKAFWEYQTFLHKIANDSFFLCQHSCVYAIIIAYICCENWFRACLRILATILNIYLQKTIFRCNFDSFWWKCNKILWEDESNKVVKQTRKSSSMTKSVLSQNCWNSNAVTSWSFIWEGRSLFELFLQWFYSLGKFV